MTTVKYAWARRQVIDCIATLADFEYQSRVWIRHELPFPGYYDELDLQVHVLFDDFEVLPEPRAVDGDLLLPGAEVKRLRELGAVFDPMIERLSEVAESDEAYLSDPEWPEVVQLAQRCLSAFIIAGGWEHTDEDAKVVADKRAEGRIPTVDLPATRRRVIKAVAALADSEYQQRTWTGGGVDPVTGSLDACLRTLTNDAAVLPEPRSAVGRVLLEGDEIDRLAILGSALGQVDITPTAHESSHWPAVVDAALRCLPALFIAGAWVGPDPDPGVTPQR